MAKAYGKYDVIIRCRPDNSMYLKPVIVTDYSFTDDKIYSTVFTPSGHRDLCFFAKKHKSLCPDGVKTVL